MSALFFLMWIIFKVFFEFVMILLLFFFFFGGKACRISASSPALEAEVLSTGLPGKSLVSALDP